MGAVVVSAFCRFIDIRWPRVRVFQAERGFDGGRRRKRPAGLPDGLCKRPSDTPPVDVFWCRGRSPDSQVAVAPTSSRRKRCISDTWIGNNSLLTVAGAVPDFRAPEPIHQLPSWPL